MGQNRRSALISITILLIVTFLGFNAEAKPELKNVIIISVDTLRADHLGCYGYPLDTSPNVDAFTRDAIRFSQCYSLTPLTTPSFSTMLTSLPPHKHGAKRNGLSIYKNVKTLPYFLKRFGYYSGAIISNWPLKKRLAHLNRDFNTYAEVFTRKRYMGIMNSEGEASKVTAKALAWLEKNRDKRVFLWVLFTEPHRPYVSHENYTFSYRDVPASVYPPGTHMGKIKKYDSEIGYTDFHIGKLLSKLKELGIYRESLIIFHADHGESFGEHNYFRHGRKLYNSTVHVPLIIKLPFNQHGNTVRHHTVSILDIGPTIFSVLKIPLFPQMEGIPLFNENNRLLNRTLLLETYGGTVHLKRNNKKFHLKVKPIRFALLNNSTKFIYNLGDDTYEAYDVKNDPFEIQDSVKMSSPSNARWSDLKKQLLEKVTQLNKYIKTNRMYRMDQRTSISEEDLLMLKSLGYVE